jgi:uncharacterized protein YdaU (DUF1376 family)
MAEFPALPVWTDAYMLDCGHLSDAEHGRYFLLLMLIWRSPGCRVPNDAVWIARKLKRTPEQYEQDIAPLIHEFCVTTGNWISQKRLLKEYNYLQKQSKKQSERAKSRWEKEKHQCHGSTTADTKPVPNGYQTDAPTPTPTPTPNTPPKGGVGAAPRPFLWEKDLWNVEGVKGSGLDLSPYPAMVQLEQDGFDLNSEVIPVLKADLARAKEQGRSNKLSWYTIANRVRENRSRAPNGKSHTPPPNQAQETSWEERIWFARKNKTWDAVKWGPYPNQPGCLAPAALLLPEDGKGWTNWGEG